MALYNNRAKTDYVAFKAGNVTPGVEFQSTALYIGNGGDLDIVTTLDDEVTLKNVISGMLLPVRVKLVKESSTATDIVYFQ